MIRKCFEKLLRAYYTGLWIEACANCCLFMRMGQVYRLLSDISDEATKRAKLVVIKVRMKIMTFTSKERKKY
jgi:hypothetical protein